MTLVDKILLMRKHRVSIANMAALLDTTEEAITQVIVHQGLYDTNKPKTIPTPVLLEYLRNGMDIKAIAKHCDSSEQAILYQFAKRGINYHDFMPFVKEKPNGY